ncbi:hypothetical protein EYR40_006236 [Pleurotus pulmonarius]|nr:hypothetical protein EYR36_010856 [Pleurotus pulmonarius]KAF4599146.1 hypothetical protein EYR40_006236 [Pleurotus pulmonarius]
MAPTTSVRRSRVLLFAALVLAGLFFFGVRWELPSALKDTSSELYSKYTPSGLTRANIVALVKSKSAVQVDEIYGLLHFVTREDGKQFDPGFDVSKPLDLDTYAQGEKSVVWSEVMKEFNTQAPIVVFSKVRAETGLARYSKKAKALLKKYDTSPAPTIVEVDLRDDDVQIKALLTRLTGRGTFPNVIVRGKTIGGSDDVRDLHSKGLLRPKLEDAGVIVQGRDSEIVVTVAQRHLSVLIVCPPIYIWGGHVDAMTEVLGLASSSASPTEYGSLERTSSSWSKGAQLFPLRLGSELTACLVAEERNVIEALVPTTGQPSFRKECGEQGCEVRAAGGMSPEETPTAAFHLADEHEPTWSGYPPKHPDPELLRQRRRASIQFQDQMREDPFESLLRSLSSKHKERKLKREARRPTPKRTLSSVSFAPDILADVTTEPLSPLSPADDTETFFGKYLPLLMQMDSFSGPPLIMPPERKQTIIHINGAGGGGDTYHGRISNSNVGGHDGQNSVRNGLHHDVEAQRLLGQPHSSYSLHSNPNAARENALLVFLFVLLAFTGISFFVDLDVLLALLKMLNGKGSP